MLEGVMRVQQLHIDRLACLNPRRDELFGINDWAPPEAAADVRDATAGASSLLS